MGERLTKLVVYTLFVVSTFVWAHLFHRWMELPKALSIGLAIPLGLVTMLATMALFSFSMQALSSFFVNSRYHKVLEIAGISIDQVLASSFAPTLMVDYFCGNQFGIGAPVVWCFYDVPIDIDDEYEWDFTKAMLVDLPTEHRNQEYLTQTYPQLRILETRALIDGKPFFD